MGLEFAAFFLEGGRRRGVTEELCYAVEKEMRGAEKRLREMRGRCWC